MSGGSGTIKQRDWERLLVKNGFRLVRSEGSHMIYKRGDDEIVPVARHNPNKLMCQRIVKQFKLTE